MQARTNEKACGESYCRAVRDTALVMPGLGRVRIAFDADIATRLRRN
jgi:hypothetical protein